MSDSVRFARDPVPEAEWEVWYRDMFDRECPPSVDVRGRGLAAGLMELWARYLVETVRPDGGEGFSRFHLRWKPGRSAHIDGNWKGATRLREWVYGSKNHIRRGYVAEAGPLLKKIAVAHAGLVRDGQSCESILSAAAEAKDQMDFERRLSALVG